MNELESALARIEGRVAAATPGPWTVDHCEPYEMTLDQANGERVPGITLWLDDCCYDENHQRISNAALIASAPTDLLLLCKALRVAVAGLADIMSGSSPYVNEANMYRYQTAVETHAKVLSLLSGGAPGDES